MPMRSVRQCQGRSKIKKKAISSRRGTYVNCRRLLRTPLNRIRMFTLEMLKGERGKTENAFVTDKYCLRDIWRSISYDIHFHVSAILTVQFARTNEGNVDR